MPVYPCDLHILSEHFHSEQRIAPASGVVALTSGVGAWNLGDFSNDIIAANAVTSPFDLHWGIISNPDANADYVIVLYYGAADIECGRIGFTRTAVFVNSVSLAVTTPVLPANSRVRAKMMDSIGGSGAGIIVFYHVYD